MVSRRILSLALAASLAAAWLPAAAQTPAWPAHSITLVVPFAAGGPTDVVARTLAAVMGKTLGQTWWSRTSSAPAARWRPATWQGRPDGYTFLIHHNGMATAPGLYRKLAYNPLTDFEYVGQVVDVPMTCWRARTCRQDFRRSCWPT
jgi:tripartite-type tricarboxylate transporter receptor subunit TctC